jgi:hypothetical protein
VVGSSLYVAFGDGLKIFAVEKCQKLQSNQGEISISIDVQRALSTRYIYILGRRRRGRKWSTYYHTSLIKMAMLYNTTSKEI